MLVHAHPDDETIGNGVTMAKYVSEGAAVCLVTCTLGEEGEVLVDDLAHLAPDQNDDLGPHRLGELKLAMEILGVTDYIRLGGDGRYRDSGMAYAADGRAIARNVLREGIFWTADLLEAANELVAVIRDRRPQVLITYTDRWLRVILITYKRIEWPCTPASWRACRPTVETSVSHGRWRGCSGQR
jgi:N-acetyl-1-D-myo-inositol-2-amino-2-deoxy-alpha-D-glucopyranoside deacetylase